MTKARLTDRHCILRQMIYGKAHLCPDSTVACVSVNVSIGTPELIYNLCVIH